MTSAGELRQLMGKCGVAVNELSRADDRHQRTARDLQQNVKLSQPAASYPS